MKGIITQTFFHTYGTSKEEMDDTELAFEQGDTVEILKEVYSQSWLGNGFYVVFNEKTCEAMTISKAYVKVK
jgi:hypothetical protein